MIRAVLLLLFAFVRASQATETWYFAQMIDTDEIVAFTMDGTVRPASVNGDWQYALRVDAETALIAIAPEGEATSLYRVTPDGATRIDVPESADAFRQPLAFSNPYLVLRQNSSPLPTTALLINVDTALAQPLTGQLPALARISADGARLRYLSADGEQWSLIERALSTGEERVIYSLMTDNPLPLISADAHGDRWLYVTYDENNALIYNLLNVDGERTQLDAGTREQPVHWSFLNDTLIGSPLGCGDDCALLMPRAEDVDKFPLPAGDTYTLLAQPTADSLLVVDSQQQFWLLQQNAEPRLVGQYNPTLIFMPAHQLVSPDGRYVLAGAGDGRYAVWDLHGYTPVVLLDARYIGLILYGEYGFLIHSYGDETDTGTAYRYAGGAIVLPHTDAGLYFDLLADGGIVYMLQKADDAIGEPGIYRYDPATGTYGSVLPGALLVYPQALN